MQDFMRFSKVFDVQTVFKGPFHELLNPFLFIFPIYLYSFIYLFISLFTYLFIYLLCIFILCQPVTCTNISKTDTMRPYVSMHLEEFSQWLSFSENLRCTVPVKVVLRPKQQFFFSLDFKTMSLF